jgi:hypothetical protein
VRLETRPPNIEGQGAIKQRQLLINCLRMRPDRIIMGEVRGEEAFDMLQAMNTGHEGSMTTIHSNTPRDAISRLESMVAMGMNMPEKSVRQQIAAAITIVVQATRMSDGTRKVTSVSEITGMEENVISMQEIFTSTRKESGPMARSSAYSSQPIFVPGSSNGFASPASYCRRPCSSAKRRSIERKGGTDMGLIIVIIVFMGVVCGRCSGGCTPSEAGPLSSAKQVYATLDSALATDDDDVDAQQGRQSSQERHDQRHPLAQSQAA